MNLVGRRPLRRVPSPRQILALLIALTVAAFSLAVPVDPAAAIRTFGAPRFSINAPGDIDFAANTLLTCPLSAANCADARDRTRSSANNEFNMEYVDVDSDGATFNSSSAALDMPPGSTVRFAGLYWGGQDNDADRDEVLFEVGAGQGYQTVTASVIDTSGSINYQGFADVTSLVAAQGNDIYTVANVQAREGRGRYAGWSLVVVYENPDEPWRNLTVFDGYERASRGNPVNITVSGFLAPPTGPVDANIGMIAYEGDNRYTGDYAEFEGVRLGDALNSTTNFFNSSITTGGTHNPGRNPGYLDTLGYDANIIETSGLIAPNATSGDIELGSNGDVYFAGVVTSAIEIFVPNLSSDFAKTVTDLDGGDANPGDILEYAIQFSNSGGDPATNVVLTDAIPAGTTYVPNSLIIADGDNPGPKSDTGGNDQAQFDGTDVEFNIGAGATAASGGVVQPFSTSGQRYEVRFQVQIDVVTPAGATISNTADVDYVAQTVGTPYNATTPSVDTPVVALADLSFTSKTDNVDPVTAGNDVEWTLTIANAGPSSAEDVEIVDSLPAGTTFVPLASDPSCSAAGQVVTCALGTVAVGSASVVIAATVDEDTPISTITNKASVTSSTDDTDPADNTANETTTIERSIDLGLTKSVVAAPAITGDAVAGGQLTYTIDIVNNGPSSATNVVVADSLPVGATVVSTTPSGVGSCTPAAGTVSCTWATIPALGTATITVVADLASDLVTGSTLTNSASVSADEPETLAGDSNADSAAIDITRRIDLSTTKTSTGTPIAGESFSFSVSVANAGESDATNVVVVDTLPAGATFIPGESSGGCSLVAPGSVECTVATVAAGDSADFTVTVLVDPSTTSGTALTNSVTASATEFEDPSTTADNTASNSPTTGRSADLSVSKTHDAEPATAGGAIAYTVTVTNRGPSDASGITITDTLPTNVSFVASIGCAETTPGVIECTVGALAAGASTSVVINGTVDAGAPSGTVLTNSASVAGNEPDPIAANNTTSITTQTDRVAQLDVFKREASGSPDPVLAGETITWEVEVINRGPSADSNIVITDDLSSLPVGAITATGPGCSVASDIVTCSVATLAVGGSALVTITVTVDGSVADGTQLINTASASGDASPVSTGSEETTVERSADLVVDKAGPATLHAGDLATYTVTLTNDGPSDASGVVVDDLLPASFGYDAFRVISGSATCAEVAGVVNCTVGTLAAGSSVVIELDAASDSSSAVGAIEMNNVVASANEPDPDPASNTDSLPTTITRSADLSIDKVARTATAVAGGSIVYDLTVTNLGPSDATAVTITDALPAGTTFSSGLSSASCTEAAGVITCDLGTLDPDNAPVVVSIGLDISDALAPGLLENIASVDAVEDDPIAGNDSSTEPITIVAEADLLVVKSAPATPPVPGENATYSISVTNLGPSVAVDATLTDTLPAGLTFVSSSLGSDCTASGTPATGQTVVCDLATVPVGTLAAITLTVAVDPALTGSIENTAAITSTTADPTPPDNTSTDVTDLAPSADLVLAKSVDPQTAVAGTNVTFALSVTSNGPSDASGITVTDTLPAGLSFVAAGTDARCADTGGGVIECAEAGPLAPGAAAVTFDVVASVDAVNAANTQLVNGAVVNADTADGDESNNAASTPVDVTRVADIGVAKSVNPAVAVAGTSVVYSIEIVNNGPSDGSSIAVADLLPAGLSLTSVTPAAGASCSSTTSSINCVVATLAAGTTTTIEVEADIAPNVADGGVLTNAVSVDGAETDPVTTNDAASADLTVSRQVNLGITKTATATPLGVAGTPQPFEIEIINVGLSDASSVVVEDVLPAGATFDAAGSAANCTEAAGLITCTVGNLAAGASTAFVISLVLDASLADGDTFTNTATVSSPEPDANAADNTSSVDVPVSRSADLAIIKQGDPQPVIAGTATTFDLSVSNIGPSDATGIEISDTLPTGLSFDAATSDAGCSAAGAVVTCAVGALATGAPSATVTIGVIVDSGVADGTLIQNTATVAGNEADPVAANDASSVVIQSDRTSSLELVKVDLVDPVLAGEDVTYQLTVRNEGPSAVDDVTIVDTVPIEFTIGVLPADCAESAANEITCDAGNLANGASATFEISLAVDSAVPHATQLVNAATAEGLTGTATSTSEETTIERVADVSVSKTTATDPVIAGEPVVYTVEVANAGPSIASNVVLADVLPASSSVVSIVTVDGSCTELVGQVDCTWATLAPGTTATVEITLQPESFLAEGVPFDNRVRVTADEADPDLDNNVDLDAEIIERSVDLSITKIADDTEVLAGADIVWTLTVTNGGPSFAANVSVVDTLPVGVEFLPASSSSACAAVGQTVTCSLVELGNGLTEAFVVAVSTDASLSTGTQLINTAAVSSDEPNVNADPTASSTVEVSAGADLTITKVIAGDGEAAAGSPLAFEITITNNGPSDATDVVVSDPLPAGFSVDTGTDARCVEAAGELACEIGTLAPGASTVVVIEGILAADARGEMVNTATVSSATPELVPADNVAVARADIERVANVSVAKTGAEPVDGSITWTIAVSNAGPATATDVVIDDQLPASLSATELPDGCTLEGSIVRCLVDEIAVDGTVDIVLTTTVAADTSGAITNTVSVSAAETDPSPDEDTSSASVDAPTDDSPLARSGATFWPLVVGSFLLMAAGGMLLLGARRRRLEV